MVPLETAITAQTKVRNLFKESPWLWKVSTEVRRKGKRRKIRTERKGVSLALGSLHRRAGENKKEENSELKGKESSVKDSLLLGY